MFFYILSSTIVFIAAVKYIFFTVHLWFRMFYVPLMFVFVQMLALQVCCFSRFECGSILYSRPAFYLL